MKQLIGEDQVRDFKVGVLMMMEERKIKDAADAVLKINNIKLI